MSSKPVRECVKAFVWAELGAVDCIVQPRVCEVGADTALDTSLADAHPWLTTCSLVVKLDQAVKRVRTVYHVLLPPPVCAPRMCAAVDASGGSAERRGW